MIDPPTIYVVAGVNGSGKSSIGGAIIERKALAYHDPDEVSRELRVLYPNMSQAMANGYAWSLGKTSLENAIARKRDFAFETTLGGRTISRLLQQAKQEGLRVRIWYVGLASVEMNISRVQARVKQGGHAIPEAKIRERWDRSRRNLISLLPDIYGLRLYDNSLEANLCRGQRPKPRLLLAADAGCITAPSVLGEAPEWAKPIIAAALRTYEIGSS